METKTGATGTFKEACTSSCFTRKTSSWKTETKGASKSSRSGQTCSGSTRKTTLVFWDCPGIGKEKKNSALLSLEQLGSQRLAVLLGYQLFGSWRFSGFVIFWITELVMLSHTSHTRWQLFTVQTYPKLVNNLFLPLISLLIWLNFSHTHSSRASYHGQR